MPALSHHRLARRRGVQCSPWRFNQLVEQACASLPPRFHVLLQNVAITVEDRPSDVIEAEGGALGLYEGTPLGDRGTSYTIAMPDKITIYRAPLMAACSSFAELREEIRLTVLHEIGHYFGMSDDELPF
jgi:predicted Zn-dependent protease with MMP-like domain